MKALLRAIRDGWLIAGLVILILLGLEAAYRGQATLKRMTSGTPDIPATHPYADSAWYREYRAEYDASTQLEWRPYVYYRRPPFQGNQINIDSERHRVTRHPGTVPPDAPSVFFFGGSTMWGDYQRDASTIPSVVVERLAAEGLPIRATNFGESGYVMTQGVLELVLQLRAGARPDWVVFYDGINDVAAAVQSGEAGIPQNEFNRASEFRLGRAVNGWEEGHGLGADARAFGLLTLTGAERSQLLQRLLVALRPATEGEGSTVEDLTAQILATYAGNVDVIEGLSAKYGFRALYFWQPNPHASAKPLTEYERGIDDSLRADPFQSRLGETHRLLDPRLRQDMASHAGDRFVDLVDVFETHAGPVWVDQIGHTTETGAAVIAGAMAERLKIGLREG